MARHFALAQDFARYIYLSLERLDKWYEGSRLLQSTLQNTNAALMYGWIAKLENKM